MIPKTFVTREGLVSQQVEPLPSRETLAFINWANVSAANVALASNSYTLVSLAAGEAYGSKGQRPERHRVGEEKQDRVRASVVHPGHISGPGWLPSARPAASTPR